MLNLIVLGFILLISLLMVHKKGWKAFGETFVNGINFDFQVHVFKILEYFSKGFSFFFFEKTIFPHPYIIFIIFAANFSLLEHCYEIYVLITRIVIFSFKTKNECFGAGKDYSMNFQTNFFWRENRLVSLGFQRLLWFLCSRDSFYGFLGLTEKVFIQFSSFFFWKKLNFVF